LEADPELAAAIDRERDRQQWQIELIASEKHRLASGAGSAKVRFSPTSTPKATPVAVIMAVPICRHRRNSGDRPRQSAL